MESWCVLQRLSATNARSASHAASDRGADLASLAYEDQAMPSRAHQRRDPCSEERAEAAEAKAITTSASSPLKARAVVTIRRPRRHLTVIVNDGTPSTSEWRASELFVWKRGR
jgi:uncharacterized protein GlcG (DUF336 family)